MHVWVEHVLIVEFHPSIYITKSVFENFGSHPDLLVESPVHWQLACETASNKY